MKAKIIVVSIILFFTSIYPVLAQAPGLFCLGKYHCSNGDCENGATDPYQLPIPDDEVVCEVDIYYSQTQIVAYFEEGCSGGVCVFDYPFGPTLKVFSYPTNDDIVRITVKVRSRQFSQMPIIMKNYP